MGVHQVSETAPIIYDKGALSHYEKTKGLSTKTRHLPPSESKIVLENPDDVLPNFIRGQDNSYLYIKQFPNNKSLSIIEVLDEGKNLRVTHGGFEVKDESYLRKERELKKSILEGRHSLISQEKPPAVVSLSTSQNRLPKSSTDSIINENPKKSNKFNSQSGFIKNPFAEGAYKGEKDLTTKILKDLEGKTTVSKQYILDATNRPELKQAERDITREVLDTFKGDTINVQEFADKVKTELLPLKKTVMGAQDTEFPTTGSAKFEDISLPTNLRGSVANYSEHIYNSPIKTLAGEVHFSGDKVKNYFGHTRIEEMASNYMPGKGKVERTIEVQADLYQKGNLERELPPNIKTGAKPIWDESMNNYKIRTNDGSFQYGTKEEIKNFLSEQKTRPQEVAKLQQYNNPTAHFRIIREDIRDAAKRGVNTKLYPTGETAMKIEGLGENHLFMNADGNGSINPNDIKVGKEVYQAGQPRGQGSWIITDILGDGKFKAVPKSEVDRFAKTLMKEEGITHGIPQYDETLIEMKQKALDDLRTMNVGRGASSIEQFDISGKVDTNNPIYRFYEKEVGRYLKNKYDAQLVTDNKGVKWWEVKLNKRMGKLPVEAFGLLLMGSNRKRKR